MSPGLEFLVRCAAETGFRIPALEKVVRLGEVVGAVAQHPLLGAALALKGGTALNLAFGQPTRLSVDLDFNYIAMSARQAMLDDRAGIESASVELARRMGYSVQQSSNEFAGRKIYLNYRSVLGPDDRIEIDLNYLMRSPVGAPVRRPLWQPGGLDRPTATLVNPIELAIGKMLALLDRGAVRDVWDVANLPEALSQVVQSEPFRPWFVGMAATLPRPLKTYESRTALRRGRRVCGAVGFAPRDPVAAQEHPRVPREVSSEPLQLMRDERLTLGNRARLHGGPEGWRWTDDAASAGGNSARASRSA